MERLLDCFLENGYSIDYASTSAPSALAVDLNGKGIGTHHIQVNDDAFDAFLLNRNPDVVLFDRFMVEEQFGWRVAKHLPIAMRVLDSEDLHGLRYAREAALNEGRSFQAGDLHRAIMFRELAAMHRCDLTLVISSYEMKLLKEHFGVATRLLAYLPFHVSQASLIAVDEMPSFDVRADFVSIGNFRHAPNKDAVKVLKEEVWPRIRKVLPDAKLHVYGAYSGAVVERWHDPEHGFLIEGHAPSVGVAMRSARVLLAPLRFGAGLKGKLVDAMRFGLPSVTTAIGAEGIADASEWPGKVNDDWDAFAEHAVALYRSVEQWNKAREQITPVLANTFQSEAYEDKMLQQVSVIQKELEVHRSRNWIGGMLQLNSQKSYEYLSKWIMAKSSHPVP
jgi:glycosyltransferase involved in cell wall biosynthesis